MAGKVEVDVGTPLVLWTAEDSQAVAEAMHGRILERTARGVGADGQPFKPYASRQRRSQQVTLRKSGRMLDTIARRGTPKRAALRTTTPYAAVQDRIRAWFGFTETEMGEIYEEDVVSRIDARLAAASADAPEEESDG